MLPETPAKHSCHGCRLSDNLHSLPAINLKMDEEFFWYTNIPSVQPLKANWNPKLSLKGERFTAVHNISHLRISKHFTRVAGVLKHLCRAWKPHRWFIGSNGWLRQGHTESPWGCEGAAGASHLLPWLIISPAQMSSAAQIGVQHHSACKCGLYWLSCSKPAWDTYQQPSG